MTKVEIRERNAQQAMIEKEGKAFKCACGRKTFQKDKVCVICKMDGHINRGEL